MAINYDDFNKKFGGEEAVKALSEAQQQNKEFEEVPDGSYICKLEKLELGETKKGQPMIAGMFRILEGQNKKQCLFINQMFCRSASGSAFPMHMGLQFLRSLKIFDDAEIDFNGNYKDFADLLLDMAEEAEEFGLKFEVKKSKDGEYIRLKVTDVIDS